MREPRKMKLVRFDLYCQDCKNKAKTESEYPCRMCLGISAREDDTSPEYFEEVRK